MFGGLGPGAADGPGKRWLALLRALNYSSVGCLSMVNVLSALRPPLIAGT